MSRLVYTGKYFDELPLKRGSSHDVRVVYLPEEKDSIIVCIDDLYNRRYKSLSDFMRFWERPKVEEEWRTH